MTTNHLLRSSAGHSAGAVESVQDTVAEPTLVAPTTTFEVPVVAQRAPLEAMSEAAIRLRRVQIRGLELSVTPMEPETLLATIDQLILSDRVSFVANHNLHSAHIVQNDPAMREFVDNADVTLIDGFPIYLLARMAPEGVDIDWRTRMRVGTLDWVSKVQTLRHLRRLAVIGSTAESNAGAVTHFRGLLPDVEILGVPGADWDARSASEAVEKLAEFRPNLVLVGLGMPRQEGFLQQYAAQLPPAVYATVGGAIDQLSGHQRGAPRILGQYGLEWLWRLVAEPRRLAYRYLIEPWFLVRPIVGRGLPRMRSDISGSAHG